MAAMTADCWSFDAEHLGCDPLAEMPGSHWSVNDCCDGVVDGVALAEEPAAGAGRRIHDRDGHAGGNDPGSTITRTP